MTDGRQLLSEYVRTGSDAAFRNLVDTSANQEGTQAVVTAFLREDFIAPPGGSPYSLNTLLGWRLARTDGGWRITRKLFFDLGPDQKIPESESGPEGIPPSRP